MTLEKKNQQNNAIYSTKHRLDENNNFQKDIVSKTTSYQQIRKAIYKHTANKYLPYKEFINQYGNKYSWFN